MSQVETTEVSAPHKEKNDESPVTFLSTDARRGDEVKHYSETKDPVLVKESPRT